MTLRLGEVVDAAIDVSGADFGSIQLIEPNLSVLKIAVQRGFPQPWVDFWNEVPKGQGSCGVSLGRGKRVIVEDVAKSPIFTGKALETQLKAGVRAVQSTPIFSRLGKPLGVFSTHYKRPCRPDKGALRLLDLLAHQAADIIQQAQYEAEAQAVLDLAPAAVFVARDPRCLEISGNRMAYEMVRLPLGTNISKSAPAGRRPSTFWVMKNGIEIAPSELPMQKAATTGQAIRSVELDLVYRDGARRSLVGNAVPLFNAEGQPRGAVATFLDITAMKESEESFRAFVNSAPLAIIIFDPKGRMAVVNFQAERMFGYSSEEMIDKPVEMLVPEGVRHQHAEERAAYMKKPQVRPMGTGLELRAKRKDGHEFPVEISLSPLKTRRGIFVSATIVDLTQRRRLEEQARLTTVLEERARVARDLHDTLAQGFTGIIMNLEAAEEASTNLPDEARIRLKMAEEVARENLEQVRHSLVELSAPSTKKVKDLTASLRHLMNRAHSNGKIRTKLSVRGKQRSLSDVVGENLLFIAQQAIDNALRHARASVVHISLSFSASGVRLQVQDNGRGFDVKRIMRGIGLTSMRDRTQYIGGRFALKSQPGKATRVEVKVPLPRKQSLEVSR